MALDHTAVKNDCTKWMNQIKRLLQALQEDATNQVETMHIKRYEVTTTKKKNKKNKKIFDW